MLVGTKLILWPLVNLVNSKIKSSKFSLQIVFNLINLGIMHHIQELILQLSHERDVSTMRLTELRSLTGAKHLQQVKHHRNMLIAKGLIPGPDQSRHATSQSKILGADSRLINIPIMGSVNAGVASLYAEGRVEDYLRVSSEKLPVKYKKTLYALRAVGDSMDEASIGPKGLNVEAGDYVIADGEDYSPESGDYVVSLINGMANIKKLVIDQSSQQILLVSESSKSYPPIILGIDDQINYLAQSKVLHVVKVPEH